MTDNELECLVKRLEEERADLALKIEKLERALSRNSDIYLQGKNHLRALSTQYDAMVEYREALVSRIMLFNMDLYKGKCDESEEAYDC